MKVASFPLLVLAFGVFFSTATPLLPAPHLKIAHNVMRTDVVIGFNIYPLLPSTSPAPLREQPPPCAPPAAGCPPGDDKAGHKTDVGCGGHIWVGEWGMQSRISLNLEVLFCHTEAFMAVKDKRAVRLGPFWWSTILWECCDHV